MKGCVINRVQFNLLQAVFLIILLVLPSPLCRASEDGSYDSNDKWINASSLPACEEELRHVVRECDVGRLRKLIDNNIEINCFINDYYPLIHHEYDSPLHSAAFYGCTEAAEMLLEAGANFRVINEHEITPLGYSAIEGNWDLEKTLLAHGAETYITDENLYRDNPLHFAVFRNDIPEVEKLISDGADVDKRLLEYEKENELYGFLDLILGDLLYRTINPHMPIHAAAYYCREEITEMLIENGANIDAYSNLDISGFTPLHISLYRKCPEVADILINADADLSLVYRDVTPALFEEKLDLTPICIAAEMELFETASKLMNKYFDPFMECTVEFLSDVIFNNKLDLLEQYVSKGGMLNEKGWVYQPLSVAVLANNKEIVKFLIDKGADVNSDIDIIFSAAKKPIHILLSHQYQEETLPILKILLEHGADPNIKDKFGKYPLQHAFELDCAHREEAIKILLSYGATISKDGMPSEEISQKAIIEKGMKSCEMK